MRLFIGIFATLLVSYNSLASDSLSSDFNFVAFGDTGTADEGQYKVSAAVEKECRILSCKFGFLLGDNFYKEGVKSVNDPQFKTKFEDPYANITFPFYITLGNHDYGKLANEWKRGEYQVQYTQINPKWILPKTYYYFPYKDVLFIVLDSSRLFWGKDTSKQKQMVDEALRLYGNKKWKIVLTHHPYLSNGKHGNAGNWDGVSFPDSVSGKTYKKFLEKNLCGKIDLVLGGHDHNLQILPGTQKCQNPFVISGAGAKVDTYLEGKNPTLFQKATLGFTTLQVRDSGILIQMINSENKKEYEVELTK